MHYDSTIIALAWPDTKVVKEGKWYDYPMEFLGFIKDDYYKVGHAALLLVNHNNGYIFYFDFGRYHTPYQYGRVRCEMTDPDTSIKVKAIIEREHIVNIEDILKDRYDNKACHGDGKLTAVIVQNIDYQKALEKISELQKREAIPYGPFKINGSTCSRFVVQIVYASTNNWLTKLLIKIPYTISATPRSNKKILNDKPFYYEMDENGLRIKKNKWYYFKRMYFPKKIIPNPQTI